MLAAAEGDAADRAAMAFSFGPFIGFWSAFDAAAARGLLAIPTGGMSSIARLELIRGLEATVHFCTPSYALHLTEVAAENQIDCGELAIRRLIVAGEPGGSLPALRRQLETRWNARVVDHAGASEVGPWGYGDAEGRGLYVIESEFIAEFIARDDGRPAASGELAELVLTALGRRGAPVLRYRTGDLVKPTWNSEGFVFLEGGVLGRADDMLICRGVNIFPSSVEQILRSFPEVVEYRITAHRRGALDELSVEVEDRLETPERIARELQLRLGLRIEVTAVPAGSLPRYEGKGRRFVDARRTLESS